MNLYKLSYFTILERMVLVIGLILVKLNIKLSIGSVLIEQLNFINRLIKQGAKVTKISKTEIKVEHYYNKGLDFKCFLRRNSSDLKVFEGVFFKEDYAPIVDITSNEEQKISYIIDAGANIGLTCIFFKLNYPEAKVIAIEPDELNFALLEKNISINGYENVKLLKAGLWNKQEHLSINNSFRDGEEWSFSLVKTNGLKDTIEGITFRHILKKFNIPKIDIMKMDIEGAEQYIFSDEKEVHYMLSKIDFLAIEIHDEFDIRPKIETFLKQNNYDFFDVKYTTFAVNNSKKND